MTLNGDEQNVFELNSHSNYNMLSVCVLIFCDYLWHSAHSEKKWLMFTFKYWHQRKHAFSYFRVPKVIIEIESIRRLAVQG